MGTDDNLTGKTVVKYRSIGGGKGGRGGSTPSRFVLQKLVEDKMPAKLYCRIPMTPQGQSASVFSLLF